MVISTNADEQLGEETGVAEIIIVHFCMAESYCRWSIIIQFGDSDLTC